MQLLLIKIAQYCNIPFFFKKKEIIKNVTNVV